MTAKTVKELRDRARQLGIKGYSKLTKEELIARLATPGAAAKPAKAIAAKPPAVERRARPRKPTPAKAAPPIAPIAPTTAATPLAPQRWWEPAAAAPSTDGTEQRIESAKYSTAAPVVSEAPTSDLGEDIDRLPPLRHSRLTLLAQKPGVLHAYWALADGEAIASPLQLRLCQASDDALAVWQEATVSDRGHWYFHVPETADPEQLLVQLGYYRDGEFISAARRAVARLPSLYASARTDRWWFISEHDFRQLYLRTGGNAAHRGLSWSASIGSPSGAVPPNERLSWPGGISSR